jgi:hypothetical protein
MEIGYQNWESIRNEKANWPQYKFDPSFKLKKHNPVNWFKTRNQKMNSELGNATLKSKKENK